MNDDIWFKRWYIPEIMSELPTSGGYRKLADRGLLHGPDYEKVMNALPKQRPRPKEAKDIIESKEPPITLLSNFLCNFYRQYRHPYQFYLSEGGFNYTTPTWTQSFVNVETCTTDQSISKNPFYVTAIRTDKITTSNTRTTWPTTLDESEGGYIQVIRMSRTLAMLLNLNYWVEQGYFPLCDPNSGSHPPPVYRLTEFDRDKWFADVAEAAWMTQFLNNPAWTIHTGGTIGIKLRWSWRSFCMTILQKTWTEEDSPYVGSSVNKKKTWQLPRFDLVADINKKDNFRDDGEYVDLFIATCDSYDVNFSSKSFYDDPSLYTRYLAEHNPVPFRPSLNSRFVPKGCLWELTDHLRNPIGVSIQILGDMIQPNIVSGAWERTMVIVPLSGENTFLSGYTKTLYQVIYEHFDKVVFVSDTKFEFTIKSVPRNKLHLITNFHSQALQYYGEKNLKILHDNYPMTVTIHFVATT